MSTGCSKMLIDHVSNLSTLVRIGRFFEHVALRHTLFFGSAHACREAFSMQTQSSHQAFRSQGNLIAPPSILMSQVRPLILLSQLLWSSALSDEDLMSSNKLQSWSWPSSFEMPVSPGIFQDAFPRSEFSGNPSHHCEIKCHQSRSKLQRLFGSVVQVSTNFAILLSFHFLVASCFLDCQVSILEKRMPNSLNC